VTLAHGASEETLTTVARRRAVVLPGRTVVTDGAVSTLSGTGRRRDGELSTSRAGVVERGHDGRTGVEVGRLKHTASSEVNVTHVLSIYTGTTHHHHHQQRTMQLFSAFRIKRTIVKIFG